MSFKRLLDYASVDIPEVNRVVPILITDQRLSIREEMHVTKSVTVECLFELFGGDIPKVNRAKRVSFVPCPADNGKCFHVRTKMDTLDSTGVAGEQSDFFESVGIIQPHPDST